MSILSNFFISTLLSKKTSIFDIRLWIVIGVIVGTFIALLFLSLCICYKKPKSKRISSQNSIPRSTRPKPKEIVEIVDGPYLKTQQQQTTILPSKDAEIVIEKAEEHGEKASAQLGRAPPEVSHLGWDHWYTLRELEEATSGLSEENVIDEGGYGIVYRGILIDNTEISVKNLLNNK